MSSPSAADNRASSAHLPQMLVISVLCASAVFTMVKPLSTADLSVFMRMGQWMVESNQLFETEIFAFTELGRTFINGTWLAQLAFYALYKVGGYPLQQLFLAIATVSSLLAIACVGHKNSGRWAGAALAVTWAFTLSLQNLGLRPQTFSLPFFALTYLLCAHYSQRPWSKVIIGGIFVAWPNLHGAFPAALVLIGGLSLDQTLGALAKGGLPALWSTSIVRHKLSLFAVAIAGSFVNAYGPGIYLYVATNSQMPRTRNLDEWLAPSLFSFMGIRLALSVLLLLFFAWKAKKRGQLTLDLGEIPLILSFLWLAVGSQRMIIWWGFVSAPIAAKWAFSGTGLEAVGKRGLVKATAAFWALLMLLANPWVPREDDARASAEGFSGFHRELPVEAIAVLPQQDDPSNPQKVFNKMMWGSYLLWDRWPAYSPFVDPRIWVFGDDIWQDYLDIGSAEPVWQQKLDHYGVQWLLLDPKSQNPLILAAKESDQWQLRHEDIRSALFERAKATRVKPKERP